MSTALKKESIRAVTLSTGLSIIGFQKTQHVPDIQWKEVVLVNPLFVIVHPDRGRVELAEITPLATEPMRVIRLNGVQILGEPYYVDPQIITAYMQALEQRNGGVQVAEPVDEERGFVKG